MIDRYIQGLLFQGVLLGFSVGEILSVLAGPNVYEEPKRLLVPIASTPTHDAGDLISSDNSPPTTKHSDAAGDESELDGGDVPAEGKHSDVVDDEPKSSKGLVPAEDKHSDVVDDEPKSSKGLVPAEDKHSDVAGGESEVHGDVVEENSPPGSRRSEALGGRDKVNTKISKREGLRGAKVNRGEVATSTVASIGIMDGPESDLGLVPTATTAPEVVSLFMKLKELKSFRARFEEVKQLRLLSNPLRSDGILAYLAPDKLVRKLEQPRPTRVIIRPAKLTTITESEVVHVDLVARPEIRGLVGSMLQLLQGDIDTIGKAYRLYFSEEESKWRLRMIPRSVRLLSLVKEIAFVGRNTSIEQITIKEASGDLTETHFVEVEVNVEFSEAELLALFGEKS
ncbi:MAG: outer membrane lipoprotein carrier protein LolA [Myxococcales bacterium]|nr:outer membrane lipoprotein carrier protein LolA [Myxococcales bacterium]